MGNLTQTTAQVQTDLDAVEASNAGLASISDLSDTTATAAKKSGFHALQASSSNAPSTDRAVLISAVRDTAASGEIRYGQVAITESNGLWWNSDDNGTLGTWSQAATVNTAQTISGAKTITGNMVFNSATLDVNGNELVLDVDGDTSITADTDDQIDVKIAGADDFQFTANTFTALSGSTIKANTIAETTSASGVTIDGVLLKDSTSKTGTLTVGSGSITDSSGSISFGNENLTTTGTLAAGVATLATGSTIGNLTLANGSITDSSGTISFGNENLTTSGNITTTAGDVTLSNGKLTVTSTDAGAGGAFVDGWHNSASPALNDQVLTIRAFGENSISEQVKYGTLVFLLQDTTDGSEDGRWQFQQLINGADTTVLRSNLGGGISVPTGDLVVDTGDLTVSAGDVKISSGFLNFGTVGASLTVSSNAITVSRSYHQVTATGSSDTVNTITGGTQGDFLILIGSSGKTITFADNVDNLKLQTDRVLSAPGDKLTLFFDGANWTELFYADNS